MNFNRNCFDFIYEMTRYWYLFLSLFFFSCSEQVKTGDENDTEQTETIAKGSFEERAKKEIAFKLNIPPDENFSIAVYKEQLNNDGVEDAVITVNRLEFAEKESAQSPKGETKKAYGYMGSYNSFFLYDGKLDKISIPMLIASSAKAPLAVNFENVQSEEFKDVTITYRIRNSAFKNYYFFNNDQLMLVFQWKLFDQVGLDQYEANYIALDKGSYSLAKDFLIYKGKIKNYNKSIPDIYNYSPEIEKDGELTYRFFFDPKGFKYMTQSKAPNS